MTRWLMTVAALAAAFCLTACDRPVSKAEAALFISPSQYADYGIDPPVDEAKYVKVTKTLNTDLTITLDYEYDPPEGAKGVRYLSQEIDVSRTSVDSFIDHGIEDAVKNTVFSAEGMTIEETKEYHYNASARTFHIINKEKNIVGNWMRVDLGKVSYTATILGAYLGDSDSWKGIFDDKLRAIEKFQW
jgi:hypothetical protein